MLKKLKEVWEALKNRVRRQVHPLPIQMNRTKKFWVTILLNNGSDIYNCQSLLNKYHPKKDWYDDEIPGIFFITYGHITKLGYKVTIRKRTSTVWPNELYVCCEIRDLDGNIISEEFSIDLPEYSYSVAIMRGYKILSRRNNNNF